MTRRHGVAPGRDEIGAPGEQRNVERRLVAEEAVGQLAVVAARFAMVARDDDEAARGFTLRTASSSGASEASV